MDKERHRVSLGMKDVYIMDNDDLEMPSEQDPDETIVENVLTDVTMSEVCPESISFFTQDMDVNSKNAESQILAQVESRAFVPPLEVTLDDIDQFDGEDKEHLDVGTVNEKKMQPTKKKAKEERLGFYLCVSLFLIF